MWFYLVVPSVAPHQIPQGSIYITRFFKNMPSRSFPKSVRKTIYFTLGNCNYSLGPLLEISTLFHPK